MDKKSTVFFTGHRTIPASELDSVRRHLYSHTVRLYLEEDFKDFICGGAVGFDMEAAECVLALKERFPDVTLSLYLPCRDQTAKWNNIGLLQRYKTILGNADHVEYSSVFYTNSCMMERNRKMADDSAICIAYRTHPGGGTDYTVKYAEKCGLRIINIGEE